MSKKIFTGPIQFKADADETGRFTAEFATLDVIDNDRDVTRPGAFTEGQQTMIEAWNHGYFAPPVGKGVIHERDGKAVIDGHFFMDTNGGQEHYKVVKNMGDLQEWSYTFEIEKSSSGEFEGQDVQFLEKLDVWGVAPVQRGAGIGTRTTSIKSDGAKPYPNEHACRLREPSEFQADSFRRTTREHDGKQYSIIMGRLKGKDTMTEQAYRYDKDTWGADAARKHCSDHGGSFEAAADTEGDTEAEAGNGKASGPSVEIVRTRIELAFLEV